MGKSNRQRRAAKARQRARARNRARARAGASSAGTPSGGGAGSRERATQDVPPPAQRFAAAVHASQYGDRSTAFGLLSDLAGEPREPVAHAVAAALEGAVAHAWEGGWQPVDLVRVVRKRSDAVHVVIATAVVVAQSRTYAELGDRVAPRWMGQIDGLAAEVPPIADGTPYLLDVGSRWVDALAAAADVAALLLTLPQLPRFSEPPSAWRAGVAEDAGSLPEGVLAKVRALLAKAEATTFDAEAEAFTAKAQELMTRHRIDRAVVGARAGGPGAKPVGRRIGIDDPYAEAKAILLGGIAEANGCRTVWSKHLGSSSVFGFADELDAVEELFTSLLVQANATLRREGSKWDHAGRSRTTRFRRSFLVAFAVRIGERLREAAETTVDEAARSSTALVPLLRARDEATRAAMEEAFPERAAVSPSATDVEGWIAGTALGDRADLSLRPKLPRTR